MKHLTIHLPYFKQGNDLGFYLRVTKTNEEALESHAKMLKEASDMDLVLYVFQ